jgi:phage minor structural protein
MIPILYDTNETSFADNGICRLRDCLTCTVTEERNGIYECDFSYPIDGANFEQIMPGRIIGVTHDDNGDIQPFDIIGYNKPIEGVVTFHAVHISYRQSGMTVAGTNINSLSDAFNLLATSAEPSNPFIYTTDLPGSGYLAAADGIPKTVRSMLGGIEGSILDVYGGEYKFDRWRVSLLAARGETKDFSIRYGVNMLDYNEDYDISGSFSSCIPYWTDGTTTIVGDRQDNGVTPSGRAECAPLDVSDRFESQPTKAQVEAEGLAYLVSRSPQLPAQTIDVSFVRLQDLGYEDLQNLLKCSLCDTVSVIFPGHLTGKFKIVKVVWDVLRGKYEEMVLGQLSTTLSEALGVGSSSGSSGGGGGSVMTDFLTASKSLGDVTLSSGTTSATIVSVTAPMTGYVVVSGYATIDDNSTGRRHAEVTVGSTVVGQMTMAAFQTNNNIVLAAGVYPVTSGDTVAVKAWQNSGSSLSAGGMINALFIAGALPDGDDLGYG